MSERRQDYPDLLAEIAHIRLEQEKHIELLREHIRETQEITDLWIHSRWLMNVLKFIAVTAGTLVGGWFAVRQFMGDK